MVINKVLLITGLFLVFFLMVKDCSALTFTGTVYDVNGNLLNNTLVNVTMKTQAMVLIGSNTTTTNLSGKFTLNVKEGLPNWMYSLNLLHTVNDTFVDFIGPTLPDFPYFEFMRLSNNNFYMKNAGTINISAVNSSAKVINFHYQIKDTKLGYPISSNWVTMSNKTLIYVPTDRNYSIMIYPQNSLPISYNLNNLTSYTNNTFSKIFNCTDTRVKLTGYINTSKVYVWDTFTVVVYLLEAGNMIFMGEGGLPYNMSAWNFNATPWIGDKDFYNYTTGFYNISVPGPVEGVNYLLFATAKNGSTYYGGFRNISADYTTTNPTYNISLYGLVGSNSNLSLKNAADWTRFNVSTAKQTFSFVNSSNSTLSLDFVHIEVKLDYSNYGANQFTFMTDVNQGETNFSIPLLNITGIQEINIYSSRYAPKRLSKSVSQLGETNITLSSFNPGDINKDVSSQSISVSMYISNSTCDVPNPESKCVIGNNAGLCKDNFNPMTATIGGGRISIRMGSGDIQVHYINVDMIASGPPDASFDKSVSSLSSGGSFEQALRFGSSGPKVYDSVLVSIPYTSALDVNRQINMSIPLFYDEDWNLIWNSSVNGTYGSGLGGNHSHYSTYQNQWELLMNGTICVTNVSSFNNSNPCYIDTNNSDIWVRLPHFSGVSPTVVGISVSSSLSSSITSGASKSYGIGELSEGGITQFISKGSEVRFIQNGKEHKIAVTEINNENKFVKLIISSEPITLILGISETKELDLDGNGIEDISITLKSIENKRAELLIKQIEEKEKITGAVVDDNLIIEESKIKGKVTEDEIIGLEYGSEPNYNKIIIIVILIILIIIGIIWYYYKKNLMDEPY